MRTGTSNANWRGGVASPVEKVCPFCSGHFFGLPVRIFCSRKCQNTSQSRALWAGHVKAPPKKPSTNIVAHGPYSKLRVAPGCGHLTKPHRTYCGGCSPIGKCHMEKFCVVCATPFLVYKSCADRKNTCGPACHSLHQSRRQIGDKSHLWQGGKTEETLRLRGRAEVAEWRRAVFSRDGYACLQCGARGKLTADHIKPWSRFPELRLEVSNGRTLCWPCHRELGANPSNGRTYKPAVREAGGWGGFVTSAEDLMTLLGGK